MKVLLPSTDLSDLFHRTVM